jgi:leader peptidase (prepilin peptidase) / N-methyltransferase
MEAASVEVAAMRDALPAGGRPLDRTARPDALVRHRRLAALLAIGLATLAFTSYSLVADGVIAAFMTLVLVVLAASDLERRIIPNRIVLPATAVVFAANIAASPAHTPEFAIAMVGAGLAFLIPNLVNSSAMGMGDVKLAAFLGAGLGWGVIGALALAFLSIFPFALGTLIRGGLSARKSTLPFGPFLAFGGLVILIVPRLVGLGGS